MVTVTLRAHLKPIQTVTRRKGSVYSGLLIPPLLGWICTGKHTLKWSQYRGGLSTGVALVQGVQIRGSPLSFCVSVCPCRSCRSLVCTSWRRMSGSADPTSPSPPKPSPLSTTSQPRSKNLSFALRCPPGWPSCSTSTSSSSAGQSAGT